MEFKQTTLENGLTVIAEINPNAASMAAGFFVRTGSRDETPEISGVSHFLEHMMFKGTQRRSAFDVNRDFDEIGASYNAATSEENTIYYGAVLPEFQEKVLDILGDILRPSLRQEDFDMEKNVIIDEIALYDDIPRFRVYDNLMSTYFAGHPLGSSILGTRESIKALKQEQMKSYFDNRYSPENVTVVGTGNLDFDAFVEKASQMCGHWNKFEVSRPTPTAPGIDEQKIIVDKKVMREHIGFMSPAPSQQDEDRFAAQILANIVGDDSGSRLFYALIDTGIADEASMSLDPLDGVGAFLTFVSTDPAKASEVTRIVSKELKKLNDEGFSDEELIAAKNKIASSATLKGELPMGRLTSVGYGWVYRKEYMSLKQQIEKLFSVTKDDIMELMQKYDLTKMTTLALGPVEKL